MHIYGLPGPAPACPMLAVPSHWPLPLRPGHYRRARPPIPPRVGTDRSGQLSTWQVVCARAIDWQRGSSLDRVGRSRNERCT
eukprot:SAG22_NODE_11241_length_494_cov_0.888608_1_plen_81_part_10